MTKPTILLTTDFRGLTGAAISGVDADEVTLIIRDDTVEAVSERTLIPMGEELLRDISSHNPFDRMPEWECYTREEAAALAAHLALVGVPFRVSPTFNGTAVVYFGALHTKYRVVNNRVIAFELADGVIARRYEQGKRGDEGYRAYWKVHKDDYVLSADGQWPHHAWDNGEFDNLSQIFNAWTQANKYKETAQ